jgi:hypothetical protein
VQIPDYERQIDHAGFIRGLDDAAFERGAAIYQRVCRNCHGTHDQPGSLPTSLRFAEGRFRSGGDPWTMYQTLTRGFGLMAAQTWMVPSQKYDVIHYIRESYLRERNSAQYVNVTDAYLAGLPKGDTRGPEPSEIQPWNAMDYGPSLAHTMEVPGPLRNIAQKGLAIRLDTGAGGAARGRHWMLYDLDTLRMAAAWSSMETGNSERNLLDWRRNSIQRRTRHSSQYQRASNSIRRRRPRLGQSGIRRLFRRSAGSGTRWPSLRTAPTQLVPLSWPVSPRS